MAWSKRQKGKLSFWVSSLLADEDWLDHGVTAACQEGEEFFNLSFSIEEESYRVANRRTQVVEAFGVSPRAWVSAKQVHSDRVVWVKSPGLGSGATNPTVAWPDTDGLVTTELGLLLATMHADCVPILLADPVRKVVAAVHAGWKGTALAIVHKALKVMEEQAGTNPRDCLAAIGPAAGQCCYQVGSELAEKFSRVLNLTGMRFASSLDLPEINRRLLIVAGLGEEKIDPAFSCTICGGEDFFSHRRQGAQSGRMASLIIRRR